MSQPRAVNVDVSAREKVPLEFSIWFPFISILLPGKISGPVAFASHRGKSSAMSVPSPGAPHTDEERRLEMVANHPHTEETLGMVLGQDSNARRIYVVAIKPGGPLHSPQRACSTLDQLLREPTLRICF